MDPSNLDLLFFRSAVFALFKAKADSVLSSLPRTERIVFGQCEFDANGRLDLLAKCLVSLFNIRDFRANSNKTNGSKLAEMPWITAISRKIFEAEMEKKDEGKKEDEMAKEKSNKLKKNMSKLEEILRKQRAEKGKKEQRKKRRKVMREIAKPRPKRDEAEVMEHEFKQYPHVLKLVRVERFYRMLDKCNEYIRRKDEEHSKILQLSGLAFNLQTKAVERNPLLDLLQMQLRKNDVIGKLSILSPKLLSIIPDRSNQQSLLASLRHNLTSFNCSDVLSLLLSPTLFSFHEQGELSLPSLLKLGLSDRAEIVAWLDLLLRISGASATLDRLISSMGSEFEVVERRIHPAIVRLEEIEQRFRSLRMSESEKQRKEMAWRGYTFISEEQSRIVLGEGATDDALAEEEEEEEADMERVLEQDIRTIAQMGDGEGGNKNNAELRGDGNGNAESGRGRRRKRFLRTEPFGQLRLLNPYLFANQIHDGAVLRRVALSPRAFSSSILSPEFGQLEVLSPRAFLAIILSPRAAIANILSPSAFSLRLLSPQAFLAEVLNPKAFIARVCHFVTFCPAFLCC
ncbi:hypothetical protein niasHS_013475 [Heterodera schachtii]|uniref:Uncharacterized protein n=1 Tax=Heterodera schachtii TaxID=97005 RepID=A0ABD2IFB6_HETSC